MLAGSAFGPAAWRRAVSVVLAAVVVASSLQAVTVAAVSAAPPEQKAIAARELPPLPTTGGREVAPDKAKGDFTDAPGAVAKDDKDKGTKSGPAGPPAPPARAKATGPVDMTGATVERREEKTDFLRTRDGRQVTRLYAAPQNVKDAAGKWVPIDATLTADDRGGFTPKATGLSARFAGESGTSETSTVELADGKRVGVSLEGAAKRPAKVNGPDVTYADVLPGADLTYRAERNGVKETLVLKRLPAGGQSSWRFPLQLTGLTPRLNDTGSVSLLDAAGTEALYVPAPSVWDSKVDPAKGEPSYAPSRFVLTQEAAGWVLTVVVDPTWLSAKERTFPVSVDPSWWSPGRNSGRWDAFVMSAYPNNNYNVNYESAFGRYTNKIGRYDSSTGTNQTYLAFDLGPLVGADIYEAYLNTYTLHTAAAGATSYRVWQLDCGWGDTTVTWNNKPCVSAWSAPGSGAKNAWSSVNMTDVVKNQVSGAWPSVGYMLESGTAQANWRKIASGENGNDVAPYMDVLHNWPPQIAQPQPGAPCNGCGYHMKSMNLTGAAGDPNGDPVDYYYRVATSPDAETNVVYNSGWTRATAVSIPEGTLRTGVRYFWHVYSGDGYRVTAPDWVWSFTLDDAPPAVPDRAAFSPPDGSVLTQPTPALTAKQVSDPDGDPVRYWFRVASGADGESGPVANSGWLPAPAGGADVTWTVPAGVLRDGVPYTWKVMATDDLGAAPLEGHHAAVGSAWSA